MPPQEEAVPPRLTVAESGLAHGVDGAATATVVDEYAGKSMEEIAEEVEKKEAQSRAVVLEMLGDLPDADVRAPENVLFVCKLNPVTRDEDLELIFSCFGRIRDCEIVRDWVTGDSLNYAFVEFMDRATCEEAYRKMDGVLIDDRRIHVDFLPERFQALEPLRSGRARSNGRGRRATTTTGRGRRFAMSRREPRKKPLRRRWGGGPRSVVVQRRGAKQCNATPSPSNREAVGLTTG